MNNSHPKGCVKRGKSVFRLKLHLLCPISYVSHQTNILVCYFTFLFDFSHSDSYTLIPNATYSKNETGFVCDIERHELKGIDAYGFLRYHPLIHT